MTKEWFDIDTLAPRKEVWSQVKMFKSNMLLPTFKKCFIFFQEFSKLFQIFPLSRLTWADPCESFSLVVSWARWRHTRVSEETLSLPNFLEISENILFLEKNDFWKKIIKWINLPAKCNTMSPWTWKIYILNVFWNWPFFFFGDRTGVPFRNYIPSGHLDLAADGGLSLE